MSWPFSLCEELSCRWSVAADAVASRSCRSEASLFEGVLGMAGVVGRLYAELGVGRPACIEVRFKVLFTAEVEGGPGVGRPD